MRRLGLGLLWGTCGYLAGAIGGALLVTAFSTNSFDRQMEAVMTGAFATGPLLALVCLAVGVSRGGRKPAPPGS